MAKAEIERELSVSKEQFFNVLTDYEKYPDFLSGVKKVKVERTSPEVARVTYQVSVMKEVTYVLEHHEDRKAGTVKWKLIESDFFKVNNGVWSVKETDDGCHAHYSLEVEFKIPVPGLILNRLIKGNLPGMMDEFEERAEEQS